MRIHYDTCILICRELSIYDNCNNNRTRANTGGKRSKKVNMAMEKAIGQAECDYHCLESNAIFRMSNQPGKGLPTISHHNINIIFFGGGRNSHFLALNFFWK